MGRGADDFDDLNLLVAAGLEDNIEGRLFRLLFLGRAATAAAALHHDRATGRRLDLIGVLQIRGQIHRLFERELDDVVAQLPDVFSYFCHDFISGSCRDPNVSNLCPA